VAVIDVEHLWKKYRRPHVKAGSVKELLLATLRGQRGYDEFWALRDVCVAVEAGEAVGVVGPNGSGRVCPLLELGTGFHPDLSGRENVYLNASLLGLSQKETRARYADIVDFAEIEEFMDSPVKTYSTGMVIRLGFSVAVHMDPDILLIDEVLGVGDEHFQHKSFERLLDFKKAGKTLFVVSHNLDSVTALCERALWMDRGRLFRDADAQEVVVKYKRAVEEWEASLAEAKAKGHEPAG
jgi:ABC-type polysaccharide/polyol phosphate transport system ATPase subunit